MTIVLTLERLLQRLKATRAREAALKAKGVAILKPKPKITAPPRGR